MFTTATSQSQESEFVPIYEEENVPDYVLPNPLQFENGDPVRTKEDWEKRREELLNLFAEHVYGRVPGGVSDEITHEKRKSVDEFLNGKAVLEEIRIFLTGDQSGTFLDLLIIKPKNQNAKSPAFLTLNFAGNHSIHPSPEISLSESWMRISSSDRKAGLVVDNKATEKARGDRTSRWPVEKIIDSGVALATFYYGDVDPDFDDDFENGIQGHYEKPAPDEWGSISAWAWGAQRAMDYLVSDPDIDAEKIGLLGHSRLGKTSLWAGAQDERFALVISNNSGCGGAALSRRRFGESVLRINTSFPHWFCDNFTKYNDNESELPVDQHELISLIAPRLVYVASAEEDQWADPRGEFLSAFHAGPVYELLGLAPLPQSEPPAVNEPIGENIRYHIRTGKHDVTEFDWHQYIQALKSLK
ncbi:MAG: acetylxylan esterase [Verrucomicrobiales bacterium]|nr:acetylxylan esterase [Verrucomicrobiales bacterium]